MSINSRQKGAAAEREVAQILHTYGFEATRDGRLDSDLKHNVQGFHFEVKRRETLALPEWTRQAEEDAPESVIPAVIYRSSRQPWRVSHPLESLLRLLKLEREIEDARD